jgi:hypothetical protein
MTQERIVLVLRNDVNVVAGLTRAALRFFELSRYNISTRTISGRVAEWLKAPVLKTGVGETPPGVRIPPRPLLSV